MPNYYGFMDSGEITESINNDSLLLWKYYDNQPWTDE